VPQGRAFRVGGMVVPGSVKRQADGVTVQFVVTTPRRTCRSSSKAFLPDLFREARAW